MAVSVNGKPAMADPDSNPFADGCTAITCYGNAKPGDKHLASTIRCVDDEIIGWLKRRERRRHYCAGRIFSIRRRKSVLSRRRSESGATVFVSKISTFHVRS
jgi:hypothetical protein